MTRARKIKSDDDEISTTYTNEDSHCHGFPHHQFHNDKRIQVSYAKLLREVVNNNQ